MELRTVEVNGTIYAKLQDGQPVYGYPDGKEAAFDAPGALAKISSLNGEAKGYRLAKEALETKLKAFDGIEDPEAAKAALRYINDGALIAAEKMDQIKREAVKAAEEKAAGAAQSSSVRIAELEATIAKMEAEFYSEKLTNAFANSKVNDKLVVPVDMLRATFGDRFKGEGGKLVAYEVTGDKMYSRTSPGDLAEFDEALERIIDAYPYRDTILKASGASGGGVNPSGGASHGTGGVTITRAEFDRLSPETQAQKIKAGYKVSDR